MKDLSRSVQALNAPAFNGGRRTEEGEQPFNSRLLVTSPFHNGAVAERLKYVPEMWATPYEGIATIKIKGSETEEQPLGRFEFIRVECQHWAPKAHETGDCRFACGVTA